jgi:tetratricopeptide (TPR) repeat protein
MLYQGFDQPDEAQEAFERAQSLSDTNLDFLLDRVRVYVTAGRLEQAKADTDRAIAENPESGWPFYLRAGIHFQREEYDRTLSDLDQAATIAQETGDGRLEALARGRRAQVLRIAPPTHSTP